MRKFFLFLFVFIFYSQFSRLPSLGGQAILNSELNTTETKLATIPEDYQQIRRDLTLSPDGRKVAYIGFKEGKKYCVFDGKKGRAHDSAEGAVISADGKFVCYGARIGRELWWKVQSADLH